MRTVFAILLTVLASPAHAQFGIGLAPGAQCPYNFQPAGAAINRQDASANIQGQYNAAKAQLEAVQNELQNLDGLIGDARSAIGEVIPDRDIVRIDEHYRYQRGYNNYWDCPANPGATASASGAGVTAVLPHRGSSANIQGSAAGATRVYPPEDFCYRGAGGKPFNAWAEVVDDRGRVSPTVCDYNIPSFRGSPEADRSRNCRRGLSAYYGYIHRKMDLERKRAQLDAQVEALERRAEQVAEGTYCPYCAGQNRGYSQGSSIAQSIFPMVGMLAMAGLSMWQRSQQPHMMRPMGPPPGMLPFPGPGAYPGRPYPAMTPGFMGVNNGVYGALPGGIGQGGFGCGGTSPTFGNPYSPPMQPFMNAGPNPYMNPYANPLMNPAMQNPMFNPGFGPGFGPVLGNGINGYNPFQSPFGMNGNPMMASANPFQNFMTSPYGNPLMGMNGMGGAPAMLPYMNGMGGGNPLAQGMLGNPYFQNPYQYNPLGNQFGNPLAAYGNPYGNPYGAMNPYGGAPGALPFPGPGGYGMPYGMGSPYGMGNPYGMGGMPGYGNPYASLYGSPYGYGNPYAALGSPYGLPYGAMGGGLGAMPYGQAYGNPGLAAYPGANASLGTFYWQMEQMKQSIISIQNSPMFGGSAPAALPYPGPGLGYGGYGGGNIYNVPGSAFNPMPQPLPPPPQGPGQVPVGGGTPNIIRTR
jgi:hypothetical protein